MEKYNFYFPTNMLVGSGRRKELGRITAQYGQKALLVIDPFLESGGVAQELLNILHASGIHTEIFNEIVPNPRNTTIDKGVEQCRQMECDVVVAVGGGSTIDTAKAIALTVVHGGKCWDYTERQQETVLRPTRPGLPLIAIPTTAGTGTEATLVSVINNTNQVRKCAIVNPVIYPKLSIVDPELMMTIPPALTALTGIDTFAHAFESYICTDHNDFSDALALHAMKLFSKSIREAVSNGSNIEARGMMAVSCALAGAAFSNSGVCLPHAMGQPLSAFTDAPHGGTLAACLPQIIEWTIPCAQDRFARVAEILGGEKMHGKSDKEKAVQLPYLMQELYKDLNVNVSFGSYGLQEKDVDAFVDLCFVAYKQDMNHHPKQVTREDVRMLTLKCIQGKKG